MRLIFRSFKSFNKPYIRNLILKRRLLIPNVRNLSINTSQSRKENEIINDDNQQELENKVRERLRLVTNPVNVITTQTKDKRISGITVNSVTSLSMSPILLSFNVKLPSNFSNQLHNTKHCAINTLSSNQSNIAQFFSKPGHSNLETINEQFCWYQNIPYLNNCLTSFMCKVFKVIPVADHEIWIVQVIETSSTSSCLSGLLYRNQNYIKE